MRNRPLISATSAVLAIAIGIAEFLCIPALALENLDNSNTRKKTAVRNEPVLTANRLLKNAKDNQYSQAKVELPDNYYALYRIVEKMARANKLDSRPWRVRVSSDYDINAFATEINLLVFFNGLLDQIYGDENALACVVGHEMVHHTKQHIALAANQRENRLQELRAEAIAEVTAEEEDLKDDLEGMGIGEWVSGRATSLLSIPLPKVGGGIGGLVGNIISSEIRRSRRKRLEKAVERINQIHAEKKQQFLEEETKRNHSQELESDEFGYQYMVRAGFSPQGCITMLEALNRLPGSQMDSTTHPAIPRRINAVRALSTKYPAAVLGKEGEANLAANPNALTYDLSLDRGSLRINSSKGGWSFD